jgi:hypothetical protein
MNKKCIHGCERQIKSCDNPDDGVDAKQGMDESGTFAVANQYPRENAKKGNSENQFQIFHILNIKDKPAECKQELMLPTTGLLHQDFLINTTPPIINAMPSNR